MEMMLLQTLLQLPASPQIPPHLENLPCLTQEQLQEPDVRCKADMRKWEIKGRRAQHRHSLQQIQDTSWNVSSSSRAVWAGQTCLPTASQLEPGCSGAGKGEVTGIQTTEGQEQQQEQGTKVLAPPGCCRRLWGGAEMCLAQTLPMVLLQGPTFWERPGGLPRRPCGSRGSSSPGGVVVPPSLSRFPGAAERAWALLCPPPPAPKDTVHLLWISAGSSSRLWL